MERPFKENQKENVVSLEEFKKKKERERDINILRFSLNATDKEIEDAWTKWWKKEVSFD